MDEDPCHDPLKTLEQYWGHMDDLRIKLIKDNRKHKNDKHYVPAHNIHILSVACDKLQNFIDDNTD